MPTISLKVGVGIFGRFDKGQKAKFVARIAGLEFDLNLAAGNVKPEHMDAKNAAMINEVAKIMTLIRELESSKDPDDVTLAVGTYFYSLPYDKGDRETIEFPNPEETIH